MENNQKKIRLSSTYGEMKVDGVTAQASIVDNAINRQMIFPIKGRPLNANSFEIKTDAVKKFMDNNPDLIKSLSKDNKISLEEIHESLKAVSTIMGGISSVIVTAWQNVRKFLLPLVPVFKKQERSKNKYKKRVANRQKLYEKKRRMGRKL